MNHPHAGKPGFDAEGRYLRSGEEGSTEPMSGLGDLALFLGGSEDSFTGKLLQLIVKADPYNRERLRLAFPHVVRTWEVWMGTTVHRGGGLTTSPTADELRSALVLARADQLLRVGTEDVEGVLS